jgi:hypothetical protein
VGRQPVRERGDHRQPVREGGDHRQPVKSRDWHRRPGGGHHTSNENELYWVPI